MRIFWVELRMEAQAGGILTLRAVGVNFADSRHASSLRLNIDLERCAVLIRMCIVTGILLGLSAFGVTQEKPDFSGKWILNRQTSTVSALAKAVQSGVVRIEHRDPMFRYKAAFESESGPLQYGPLPYEYELRSDGREVGFIQQGLTTVSSLRWQG